MSLARIRCCIALFLAAGRFAAAAPASQAAPAPGSDAVPHDHAERFARGERQFASEIQGILTQHCLACHGGESIRGGFDLHSREALLQGGDEGVVVVPFQPAKSRLLDLLRHDAEPHMPRKADRLADSVIAKVSAWIENGAPYSTNLPTGKAVVSQAVAANPQPAATRDSWWAFHTLRRPEPPAVADAGWVRTPVDAFLLAAMEKEGIRPAPRAAPRTLVRRAALDLLGLPPKPEDVEAFERDPSPWAWSNWVSRLLDRPAHGERWARHWLDVARFAESSGFEHDYDRPHAYHFRDFVIRALNADMPFDQFVRWQIAGDEVAPEAPEALMATGFLGAGVFPTQITANEVERTRYDAMDDMLSTTSTAFLGLTVGCARCHDHKFDPISTEEYYRLLSTFTTTVRSEVERDLNPERTRREKEAFDSAHAPLVRAVEEYEKTALPARFDAWLASGEPLTSKPTWRVLTFDVATSKNGATLEPQADGSYLAKGKNPDSDRYEFTWTTKERGFTALRLEALPDPSMTKGGPGRADNGNFALSRIRVRAEPLGGGAAEEIELKNPRADFEQNSGNLAVAASLDDNAQSGWAVDPKFGERHAAVFDFAHPVGFEKGTRLSVVLEFNVNTRHQIGRPRLAFSTETSPSWEGDGLPAGVATALAKLGGSGPSRAASLDSLTAEDRNVLFAWWKRSDAGWRERQTRVEEHAKTEPKPALTKILMCGEGYTPVRMHTQGADFFPETHLLNRGSTDQKKGVATQGFLRVLMPSGQEGASSWKASPPPGARFSARRKALADWMTDTEQGAGALLARVIVNRLWQHHFGRGLVGTPNDFGRQGSSPTHPELLEWLASELVRNGWRLKPIHECLMNSAAYQVASVVDSQTTSAAPPAVNDYSRYAARRLEGEVLRDAMLAVCGVLDPAMFGPGTLDEASRRRSIYFTVKRSQLVSVMQAFDAPEPLVSQGARPTTTVAPQALYLMNNPQVRSWVLAYAASMIQEGPDRVGQAVPKLYRTALGRVPSADEAAAASAFLEAQASGYRRQGADRPEMLAFADLTQVVLSLNEFAYVE